AHGISETECRNTDAKSALCGNQFEASRGPHREAPPNCAIAWLCYEDAQRAPCYFSQGPARLNPSASRYCDRWFLKARNAFEPDRVRFGLDVNCLYKDKAAPNKCGTGIPVAAGRHDWFLR